MSISRRKKYGFVVIVALLQVVALEAASRLMFVSVPEWERRRQLLRGELEFEPEFQYSVGQAYLLYVPAPNFKHESGLEHNAHGYRGKALRQARTPGVARVLCLGGSTTYGWGVPDSTQTYPAHLERLLNQQPPAGFKAVEVLNAGIPYGTTAEMLTHYHFKFHFYDPDLVILNPGGNDAQGLTAPYYHPDYSHWRQPLVAPQKLAPRARRLLQSHLMALFLVPILYDPAPDSKFVNFDGRPPMAPWYDRALPNPERQVPTIPNADIAFGHNLRALVDEILRDGHRVLLVPFRLNPRTDYGPGMMAAVNQEEQILREMAASRGLPLGPFPANVISPENWLDACCHTSGRGNLEKAEHVLPFVRQALEAFRIERTGEAVPTDERHRSDGRAPKALKTVGR